MVKYIEAHPELVQYLAPLKKMALIKLVQQVALTPNPLCVRRIVHQPNCVHCQPGLLAKKNFPQLSILETALLIGQR